MSAKEHPNLAVEHWSLQKKAVRSQRGVVAAQSQLAARTGASILADGGNAVDAAVATAFALAVAEPWMCGLGGSGYLLLWDADAKVSKVFDFQGVLPKHIDRADYPLDPAIPDSIMGFPGVLNECNTIGYRAIALPGAVKGLSDALTSFGTMPLHRILSPVIKLATDGAPASWFTTLQIALAARELSADVAASRIFMPDGVPLQPAQRMHNPALAVTLKTLAEQGADTFYGGQLGEQIVADLAAGGSRITLSDLSNYEVIESESLQSMHRGTRIHTAGPTSGGPRLIDTLQSIQGSLDTSHGIGSHSWLVYARSLRDAWRKHSERIGRGTEVGGCTSHLSCVDEHGNMVALTYTLLSRFGSGVVLPSSGILMNNAVSYFDPRPGYATSMESAKRINASNMCPTIAVHNNEAMFAVGASGANYIMPCTAIITALMLDHGLTLEQALSHPRLDVSEGGNVCADPMLGRDVTDALAKEFPLELAQRLVFPKLYACPSGVSRDPATGSLYGMNDPSQPIGGAVSVEDLLNVGEHKAQAASTEF